MHPNIYRSDVGIAWPVPRKIERFRDDFADADAIERAIAFKHHALAHISQLQLKASLSLIRNLHNLHFIATNQASQPYSTVQVLRIEAFTPSSRLILF